MDICVLDLILHNGKLYNIKKVPLPSFTVTDRPSLKTTGPAIMVDDPGNVIILCKFPVIAS